jgi:hypothetical protein
MANRFEAQGVLHASLANDISLALEEAAASGLSIDQALGVILGVVSDYGRAYYRDEYVIDLATLLLHYSSQPVLADAGYARDDH